MTPDEYLEHVLQDQRLTESELSALRQHRTDVQAVLEEHFTDADPSIQYAGSYKKKTMIREAYDLDVACYFQHEDTSAGETLQEIYDAVAEALSEDYYVDRKRSALRVMQKDAVVTREDLRIDVVPGRYTDDTNSDVFLHQEAGDKDRLKTNLQVHVTHIRDSGVRDTIKLMKLWKHQRNVRIKSFVLELLVVDLLKDHKTETLSSQIVHLLTQFRDHAEDLSVVDPANSNNDLKPLLDEARAELAAWASLTLNDVDQEDWESVFGKLPERAMDAAVVTGAIARAASSSPPSRPWLPVA